MLYVDFISTNWKKRQFPMTLMKSSITTFCIQAQSFPSSLLTLYLVLNSVDVIVNSMVMCLSHYIKILYVSIPPPLDYELLTNRVWLLMFLSPGFTTMHSTQQMHKNHLRIQDYSCQLCLQKYPSDLFTYISSVAALILVIILSCHRYHNYLPAFFSLAL